MNLATSYICPSYALNSTSFYSRCLPSIISSVVIGVSNSLTANSSNGVSFQITDLTNTSLTDQMIAKGATYVLDLLNLKTTFQYILEDFISACWLIGTLLAIAAFASFIYIMIMRWILGKNKKFLSSTISIFQKVSGFFSFIKFFLNFT